MKGRRQPVITMVIVLILCIGGTAAVAGYPITITDDAGSEVTVYEFPDRIVSLAPSSTELLFAVGAGDRLVAVAEQSDYPEEALGIPTVGGFKTISIEKVLSAHPDLVVGSNGNTPEVLDRLRTLGCTVLVIDPETILEMLDAIMLLGMVCGNEMEAAALHTDLTGRIDAIADLVQQSGESPTVAHIVWHDPLWVSGNTTFQHEVITRAGGINVFAGIEEWGIVSLEEFVAASPEYILVNSGTGMHRGGKDLIYQFVVSEPRFQRLDAVKNQRVIIVDADTISRGGPRIVDALVSVVGALHPALIDRPPEAKEMTPKAPLPGILAVSAAILGALLFSGRRS